MEVGTIIKIERTRPGCLAAQNCVGIVTDEKADHGLYDTSPGYNVALIGGGSIWRINEDARVKILYRPNEYKKGNCYEV